jgi:hypothetical protein
MQIMITRDVSARVRVFQFSRWQGALLCLGLVFVLMLSSGAVYHWFFLKAAREGWPVVSSVVKWVVRDEIAQRDRFMRESRRNCSCCSNPPSAPLPRAGGEVVRAARAAPPRRWAGEVERTSPFEVRRWRN